MGIFPQDYATFLLGSAVQV